MTKAIVKKDLGKVKAGTVLHYTGGVFAHKGSTFMAEDVYFDDVHFEVIEAKAPFADVLIEQAEVSSHTTYPSQNLAASFLHARIADNLA